MGDSFVSTITVTLFGREGMYRRYLRTVYTQFYFYNKLEKDVSEIEEVR